MEKDTIRQIVMEVAQTLWGDIRPLRAKPIYNTSEAAAYLGVKRSYVYELIHTKKLPYFKSEGGKLTYIRREDLDAWAMATRVPSLREVKEKRNQSDAHD